MPSLVQANLPVDIFFAIKRPYISEIHLGPPFGVDLSNKDREKKGNSLSCVTAKFIPVQRTDWLDRFSPTTGIFPDSVSPEIQLSPKRRKI